MRIVINAINLVSAGTLATGKQFLSALSNIDPKNRYLIVVPSGYGYEKISGNENFQFKFFPRIKWLYKLWRIYQDFVGFRKLVHSFKADAVIVLGNISPVKLSVPTVVLLRNPYYVDLSNFEQVGKKEQILKKLEIFFFYLTTKQADAFIVQSNYMKERLSNKWNVPDSVIEVIPNAISTNIASMKKSISGKKTKITPTNDEKFKILYVSRYYPHKNHKFILRLAKQFQAARINDLVFIVTLNEHLDGVKAILREIHDNNLDDFIYNIGEVPQEELVNWYQSSDILFFPSYLETFGNAFVEAMSFGLPICAVALPYARSVCDEAAIYYQKDSVEDAAKNILRLKNDIHFREKMSNKSKERFYEFPSWEEVARRYLSILENLINKGKHLYGNYLY